MKNMVAPVTHYNYRHARAASTRLLFCLVAALLLASCLAETDRLAVYENNVLEGAQVEEIAGYYSLIELNGGFGSLSLVPRNEPWLYQRNPGAPTSPNSARQENRPLSAVDVSLKSVTRFDDGNALVFRLDGVAVLSGIPGSDLVLASIAGETLSVRDEQGKMTATSAQLNTRNIFFVFQPSGKAITLKLYPENDKELKRIFVETENPLPTARLLDVLNATAVRDFATEDLPVLVQSSRKQREAIEKEFEAVSLREAAAKSR